MPPIMIASGATPTMTIRGAAAETTMKTRSRLPSALGLSPGLGSVVGMVSSSVIEIILIWNLG